MTKEEIKEQTLELANQIYRLGFIDGVEKTKNEYKKKGDDVVRVGDEVAVTCYGNGIVTRICNNTFAVTWADGTNGVVHEYAATKTGKSFPKMVDILEALK